MPDVDDQRVHVPLCSSVSKCWIRQRISRHFAWPSAPISLAAPSSLAARSHGRPRGLGGDLRGAWLICFDGGRDLLGGGLHFLGVGREFFGGRGQFLGRLLRVGGGLQGLGHFGQDCWRRRSFPRRPWLVPAPLSATSLQADVASSAALPISSAPFRYSLAPRQRW